MTSSIHTMPDFSKPTERVVVLADGLFPQNSHVLALLKTAATIVCCDGSANKLVDFGITPTHIVGDLDSVRADLKLRYADRLHYSSCQETNDLTKAVNFCRDMGWNSLYILGASGLREDHMLANISLLADYAEHVRVEMLTDTGVFTPILSTANFESKKEQQVSIFSLSPECPLSTEGLRYAVNNRPFRSWWQGTLNEALDGSFRISFDSGRFIIFRQYTS